MGAAVWFAQNASYGDHTGWGDSGFKPAGSDFVGSQCGQGFVHTLFHKRQSEATRATWASLGFPESEPRAKQIDRCIWNYQSNHQCPEDFDCNLIRVHHKPTSKPSGRDCGKLKFRSGASKPGNAAVSFDDPAAPQCTQQCVQVGANCKCGTADSHVKRLQVDGEVTQCESTAYNAVGDEFKV